MIELKKFGEVCDFVRGPFGGSLKKSCFVEEGYAVYEQQHAIYNQFSDIRYFVAEDKFNEMQRFELKPNDLIMSCSGTMGKVAIVPKGIQKGIINQALLKLTPKDFLDVEYLKYWMSSPDFDSRIKENTVGAAIKNVASVKILKQIDVPTPPLEEQKQIVAILDDAFAAIEQAQANIEKNIDNAKELFQSKLNDIFSQKGEGWEEKVWDDVLEIRSGRNQKQVLNPEGKYPILGSAGKVMGYADDFICEEYTTIVGRKGTINNPMLIKEKFWNVDTAFGLHAKDGLNKLYLFYFCRSFDFEKMDRGSGRPSLVKSDLLKIKMPVPSLENQQRIIEQFETLYDEIILAGELYKQKLTNLEDLKKSLLEQAFAGKLTHKDMPA